MKALSKLSADLRLSIRGLAKSPVLAVLALASLTLGIGANSAIFSVFSSVFCWYGGGINNFDIDGARYRASLARVSNNYFKALEIQPFLGRFISDSEVGSGAGQSSPVAVISYRVWRTWFHADPHVIGHTLRIDGVPFTVIGVQPEGYEGLVIDGASDITVPLFPPGTQPPSRDRKDLAFTLFARLQPAVTYSQADATLRTIWPHILQATAPDEYRGERRARFFSRRIQMQSASTGISFLRIRFSRPLRVLQATAGIILFIACLNLANLFLAKAAADRHQYAVQAALGASRWDLVSPRLVEPSIVADRRGMRHCSCLLGRATDYPNRVDRIHRNFFDPFC